MQNPRRNSEWPAREDYDRAMRDIAHSIKDPALARGTLARNLSGSIQRYGGAGLYVCVYRIDSTMIRCFRANLPYEPPKDIRRRYQAIEAFIAGTASQVSALIPIKYFEHGIRVNNRNYPIVTMPYLKSVPGLGEFIELHHQNHDMMLQLAHAWLKMIQEMESVPMAHGDLDLSNVLVEDHGGKIVLRLIDYDNLWIPALQEFPQTEGGHEHFQHPAFLPPHDIRPYTAEMDRFSSLVIYLSIKALLAAPGLYDDWRPDESFLLLIRQSYEQCDAPDGRIAYLRKLPGLEPFVAELVAAIKEQRMPKSILAIEQTQPGTIDVSKVERRPPPREVSLRPPRPITPQIGSGQPPPIRNAPGNFPQSPSVPPISIRPRTSGPGNIIFVVLLFIVLIVVLVIVFVTAQRSTGAIVTPAAWRSGLDAMSIPLDWRA